MSSFSQQGRNYLARYFNLSLERRHICVAKFSPASTKCRAFLRKIRLVRPEINIQCNCTGYLTDSDRLAHAGLIHIVVIRIGLPCASIKVE